MSHPQDYCDECGHCQANINLLGYAKLCDGCYEKTKTEGTGNPGSSCEAGNDNA